MRGKRWTNFAKAEVILQIESGQIAETAACQTWEISGEELEEWRRNFEAGGLEGLKTTKRKPRRTFY